jgi:hypothetical protein
MYGYYITIPRDQFERGQDKNNYTEGFIKNRRRFFNPACCRFTCFLRHVLAGLQCDTIYFFKTITELLSFLCNFPMSVHVYLTTRHLKQSYHVSRDDYFSRIYSKVGGNLVEVFIPMPTNPTKAKLIFASMLTFFSTEKFQISHVFTP